MNVVTDFDQLRESILELERGRTSSESGNVRQYRALIKRGTCFIPYVSSQGLAFAPSRFVGYVGNSLRKHADNPSRDGRITNEALNRLLGIRPLPNEALEARYLAFCTQLGFTASKSGAFGVARKYWATQDIIEFLDSDAEKEICQDPNLGETEKAQLIKARLGQGLFRERLLSFWGGCCLTGCSCLTVLRASHIKPWRDGNNEERLDVFNGLLLSPNMDALFDKGLISFRDSGDILISPKLSHEDRSALGCSAEMKIALRNEHIKYIAWHRANIYDS